MIRMMFLQQQRSGIGLSFVEPWVCPCCRQPLAAELSGDRRMAAGYPESFEKQSSIGGIFCAPVIFDIQRNFLLSRASFKFVQFCFDINPISRCLRQRETRGCGVPICPICGCRPNGILDVLGFNVMHKLNQME